MANEIIPASVRKLQEMGFDPIEKLVEFHDRLERDIYHLTHDDEGNPKARFSTVAYIGLLNLKQKVSADLLRYKYARVPESNELKSVTEIPTTQIVLELGEEGETKVRLSGPECS